MSKRSRTPRRSPRSRSETKQATRAALIAAAIEEFAAHGLDVSLDAICARADLTRGAFYVHFDHREDLIAAAMQEVLGDFVRSLTAADAPGAPRSIAEVAGAFFAAAESGSSVLHGGTGLRFFHLLEACHRSKQLGNTYRIVVMAARDQLARILADDQAAGRIRADVDAPALADLLVLMALGLVVRNELELPLSLSRLSATSLAVLGA